MLGYVGFLITFGLTAYFITQQFKYAKVTKFRYYVMPIFAFGQFVYSVCIKQTQDIYLLVGLLCFSLVIGYFQTTSFQLQQKTRATQLYVMQGETKVPVMRQIYYSRGGSRYLVGWFLIFLVQLLVTISRQHAGTHQIMSEFLMDVLTSLFVFLRIGDGSSWWVWEIYACSSLVYYFVLIRRHPTFSAAMRQT